MAQIRVTQVVESREAEIGSSFKGLLSYGIKNRVVKMFSEEHAEGGSGLRSGEGFSVMCILHTFELVQRRSLKFFRSL